MTLATQPAARRAVFSHRILSLTILFWIFSYVFLAARGAMMEEQWSGVLSVRRAIAVTAGAGAYWLVLKKLETMRRVSLASVVGWIVAATLAVLVIRLGLDRLLAADPLPPLRNVRWTLAWSAYFGLWVMGTIAFGRGIARAATRSTGAAAATATRSVERALPAMMTRAEPIDAADLDWLIDVIAAETHALGFSERRAAAARIFKSAGYEIADDLDPQAAHHNRRVRLASRVAARLVGGR